MLNFQNNFFFAKFTVLFFILTIFGYWGIDLNSEELYIAFSFFLLVILGVLASRQAILLLFVKLVNAKYFRILSDLLVVASALILRVAELRTLAALLTTTSNLLLSIATNAALFFQTGVALSGLVLSNRALVLSSFLPLSATVFFKTISRVKRFYSFHAAEKFFSIKF